MLITFIEPSDRILAYCRTPLKRVWPYNGIKAINMYVWRCWIRVRKRAKIRKRYNQAPHLTQDTKGKVTTSKLDITNESQEVSPFPAGDHKTPINRPARKHNGKQDRNKINDPRKKHRLGTVSRNILLEGFNRFHGVPISPLVQIRIKTHGCLVYMKDPQLIQSSSPRASLVN